MADRNNHNLKRMSKHTVVMTPRGWPCIVSEAQKKMLVFVSEHPGALYAEVAEHIGFDIPSTTTYASRMEKAGLITREKRRIGSRTYTHLTLRQGVELYLNVVHL